MKKYLLILSAVICFASTDSFATNIIIIKSKYVFFWSKQDTIWKTLAKSMGYNAVIDSANVLDDTAFFPTTDILLFSEAEAKLSNTELQNIIKFVKKGKSAYIQAEYLDTFPGSKAFKAIMDSVGADFKWSGSVSGNLEPMQILGSFATTPFATSSLLYFNYGLSGTGSGVDSFLVYNGQNFGFYYHVNSYNYGPVITISDEDWIYNYYDTLLMKNILYALANSSTGLNTPQSYQSINIFPNPAIGEISISSAKKIDEIKVIDMYGQVVYESTPRQLQLKLNLNMTGVYFITVTSGKVVETHKVIVN